MTSDIIDWDEVRRVARADEELIVAGFGWREAISITNENVTASPALVITFRAEEARRREYQP